MTKYTAFPEKGWTVGEEKKSLMENFSGRLKTEMFCGEKLTSVDDFLQKHEEYVCYLINERVYLKSKEYRTYSA